MAFGRTKQLRQAKATRRDGSGGVNGMTLIMSLLYGCWSAPSGNTDTPSPDATMQRMVPIE